MKSSVIDEFIKYAKEQFGYDIILKSSETPDTFAGIFGASFLEQDNGFENVEYYENGLQYEENYGNNRSGCQSKCGSCPVLVGGIRSPSLMKVL